MLEKEPGSPWIHRLRIIELFDAQANAGFQIFVGRKLMQHAVDNQLLREESFGSTPGKMASSALAQKLLCVDQLRLERRAGGIFDCNATGCYDRILPPLASVHMQVLGLHRTIGTLVARLMFLAKNTYAQSRGCLNSKYIRTTKQTVLHGIGQGNGGGPAMWVPHLTVMFVAFSSVCWGFALMCVQQLQRVTTVRTGYVDDVTLGLSVNRDQAQTENTVQRQIQRMGQLWEQLRYVTGGRLELSKSFWVPITWKWKDGLPRMVLKTKRGQNLYLKESESRESICIPKNMGSDTEKRLGVWSTCDGTWKVKAKKWYEFSASFGSKVRSARIGRVAGRLAYQSMWLAKFRYSAPVISLTPTQLQKVRRYISARVCQCQVIAIKYHKRWFTDLLKWAVWHGTIVVLYSYLKN